MRALRRRRHLLLSTAVVVLAGTALWAGPAQSQDAIWRAMPGDGDFNTGVNWSTDLVPTGTAFFDVTDTTSLFFTANTTIGGWTFNAGAANFDFTNAQNLAFNGAGIVINDGSATITNNFGLDFLNASTAGNATITNNGNFFFNDTSTAANATITNSFSSSLQFSDTSTAGNATITNGGFLDFRTTSTAGSATITNDNLLRFFNASTAGSATITNDFILAFNDTSTAGSATITNSNTLRFFNTSSAGSAAITNTVTGIIDFFVTSTAGSATITNDSTMRFSNASTAGSATATNNRFLQFNDTSSAGSATITNNGDLFFFNTSSAGSATITNNDFVSSVQFFDTSTAGSATITNNNFLQFSDTSTAGSATITNNSFLGFFDTSTAGQAHISTIAPGTTDFSGSTGPLNDQRLTAGSLAGDGRYFLGANELTVGGNDLSTEVAGVISDCGPTGNDCINVGATGGSLVKTGTGTFTLSGANIYTGPTTVTGGTLAVDGSIVSNVTVNNGGTLGGTGQVGGVNVNGGGIFAPGNSIGTQTVSGDLTLGAGAIFEVEVNAAGQSDKVIVNNMGSVNLTGATLRVLAENGNYAPSTDYVIIQKDSPGAVTGTFATVTSNLAFLVPTVFYNAGDGNDVVLNLERSETLFPDVARTKNQKAVADALEKFPTDNPLFLAVLNQTTSGARQAFDALSGEIHATVAGTLADDSRYVREAVLGRLMQASHTGEALSAGGPQVASLDNQAMALGYDGKSLIAEPAPAPLAFWTRAFGAWGDFDTDGNAASADRDLGGFVSGMDASIGGSWRAGLATGASFSNVDVDARFSSADVETYHLGGYLGGMAGGFALRGGGMWAWSEIDTSRAVAFPGFFERQTADYDADTGQLFGEVAYPMQMGGIALEPFGGLAFVSVDTDSFVERGGPEASLLGRNLDQDVGYTSLGLRMATTMMLGSMQVVPHLSAAWLHAFDDVTPGAALAFATTGIGFAVDGVPLAEDSALLDAGLDFALSDRVSAGVSYTGQYGDGVTDNGVKGRFTWLF